MNIFKNKIILITGASFGIGETFAYRLNDLGANLILTARSKDKLDKMALEMKHAQVISGDLSDPMFPDVLYSEIKKMNLTVDILINNAGFGFSGLFLDSSMKNYEEMLNVNVFSLTKLTHLFLKDMVSNKKGGIINISSLASFQPIPYFSIYAATKAYVTSFTMSLYEEYRDEGLIVLGFPSNDFFQEFTEEEKVKEYCRTNYKAPKNLHIFQLVFQELKIYRMHRKNLEISALFTLKCQMRLNM